MSDGIQLMVTLDDDGTPKIEKVTQAVDGLGKQSKRTKKTFNKSMKSMSGAATKLTKMVTKLATSLPVMLGGAAGAAGMGALVKQGLAFNGSLEAIETQFKVILGSSSKARDVMADIVKFSAETPFQLEEVARAGKMLEAFGLGGIANLELVGDAAAAAGRPIEEIAMVFGRIKSGAFGEAFMRLAETGLATRDMLEAAGLEFDRGGAYIGSAEDAMKAVQGIVKTRYGGMMKEMATTWTGATSTMKDNWNLLVGAFTKPLFEKLKPRIETVIETLVKWRDSKYLDTIATSAAEAIDQFIFSIVDAIGWIKTWGGTIATVAQSIAFSATAVFLIAQGVELWAKRQVILNTVMKANPWGLIVVALAAAVPWILKGVKALGGWGVVMAYIVAGAKTGWAYFKGFFEAMWAGVKWIANVWWEYQKLMFDVFVGVAGTVEDAMKAVDEIMIRTAENIISVFMDVGKGLYKAITFQFDDMKEAFGNVGAVIEQGWDDNLESLQKIGEGRFDTMGERMGNIAGAAAGEGFNAQWDKSMDAAGDASAAALAAAQAKMDEALGNASGGNDTGGETGTATTGGGVGMVEAQMEKWSWLREAYASHLEQMAAKDAAFVEYQKELWGGWAGEFVDIWQVGFSDAFSAAILEGQHLQQALDDIWQGMKGAFVQMAMDMMTSWIFAKIKMAVASVLFEKKVTGAAVSGAAARSAATAAETSVTAAGTAADTAGAAGKTFKAHAGIPFVGIAMAVGMIALMMATMGSLGGKRTGGMIPGYGSGNEDNQMWNLSSGEFVQPKGAVDYYGAGFMEAIRTRTFNPGASAGVAAAPVYIPANIDNSVTVNLDGVGGGDDQGDFAAQVEDVVGEALETLVEQRRLKLG